MTGDKQEPEITITPADNGGYGVKSPLIVVSNRLPFVLKRNAVTGALERQAR
jgi:hypothetical protein